MQASIDRYTILREYGDNYQRVFGAAFQAGVRSAQELSDAEVEHLRRYTGVVGLIAEHVALDRDQAAQKNAVRRG